MQNQKKRIVILGGGFAGLRAARRLSRLLPAETREITLVDERTVHIYTPDLYEIATAFHEKKTEECLTKLKDTVALPFTAVLNGTEVNFVRGTVSAINPAAKKITLKSGDTYDFDYAAVCLGSAVNYYGIPGLMQFSHPLKTLSDALAINCRLDIYFHTLWKAATKKRIAIVVGGGGATGVEFACELPGYLNKLCKKYQCTREQVFVTLVEGSESLAGQGAKGTSIILERFKKFDIKCLFGSFITEVTANEVKIRSGGESRTLPMDILIWSGGVMPHPLIKESFKETAKNGGLPVNGFLQHIAHPCIFAGGDNAAVIDQNVPLLAQIAVQEGDTIARNIAATIQNLPLQKFIPSFKGVVVPVGGMYAIWKQPAENGIILKGFFVWVARRLIDLWYALSILPFPHAVRKWIHDTHVFIEND